MKFYAVFFGFFSGVTMASVWPAFVSVTRLNGKILLGILATLVLLLICFRRKNLIVILFLIGLCTALIRFSMYTSPLDHDELWKFIGQKIEGSAVVTAEPDRRDNALRLTLSIIKPAHNGGALAIAVVPPYSNIAYGDQFNFSGTLEIPKNFQNDLGRQFDYIHFLEKDGILFQLNKPIIKNISHGHGEWLEATLLKIKYSFLYHEALVIPEPALSLLGGLLLGTKQSLGKSLLADFQKAGVIHMVVISGYNITIVAEAIATVLSFVPRIIGLGFSAGAVIMFVLMTGASSASVRAAIMTICAILGKFIGRKYDVMRALLFSALIMVFANPLILIFDPSFQLSFGATLGLLVVSPILVPLLVRVPDYFKLRETVAATVSTQIFLLPFLLYQSGIFSVLALPVNLLVLFPVPFTMLLGFVTGLASYISLPLATLFGFVAHIFLSYILYVVTNAAKQSFATVTLPPFSFKIVIIIYLIYAIILWKLRQRNVSRSPPNSDWQKMPQCIFSDQLEHSPK